jgi:hypothetical protein
LTQFDVLSEHAVKGVIEDGVAESVHAVATRRPLKVQGTSPEPYLVASRGSHRQFKHASKPGRVTVPGKPSDDLAPGTLNSVLKQAGLKS